MTALFLHAGFIFYRTFPNTQSSGHVRDIRKSVLRQQITCPGTALAV